MTLLQSSSPGYRESSSPRLSLLSLLTNTLPGHSASEVTHLRHYKNLFIIIFTLGINNPDRFKKLCHADLCELEI